MASCSWPMPNGIHVYRYPVLSVSLRDFRLSFDLTQPPATRYSTGKRYDVWSIKKTFRIARAVIVYLASRIHVFVRRPRSR